MATSELVVSVAFDAPSGTRLRLWCSRYRAWAFTMEQLQHILHAQGGPPPDTTVMDTAETVYISSLALLKMLKHGTSV